MKKILVVDDSPFFRKALNKALSGTYDLDEAPGGKEALVKIQENDFDLFILDIEMPEMDGLDLFKAIQELEGGKYKEIPAVFFSSSDKLEHRQRGFELGATDFLKKEYETEDLLVTVARILQAETRFEGLTAVIVDDSETSMKILTGLLKSLGLTVHSFSSTLEASEFILEKHLDMDMLITCQVMPDMSGIELIQKIKKDISIKNFPIIMLTEDTDKSNVVKYFNAGATDYFVKPFIAEELMVRFNALLESHTLKKYLKVNVQSLNELSKLKDKFLSICSHDLRSPLNGILGFTQLLGSDKTLNDTQKRFISAIRESGMMLLDLINNLLDLRTIEISQDYIMEPLVIETIVKLSTTSMSGAAKAKEVILENHSLEDGETMVEGNSLALRRVLNNLLSNSIKFTPKNKTVSINTENDDKFVKIIVTDEGLGIKPEKIKTLFDPNIKASSRGTEGEVGTGLGLSIVSAIVEKHNGTISAESDGKSGSVISISLPLYIKE